MELTIKHLAPYLPYYLCCYLQNEQETVLVNRLCNDVNGVIYSTFAGSEYDRGFAWIKSVKPLLHPLTDLNQEFEQRGQKFVPIVELGKFYNMKIEHFDDDERGNPIYGEEFFWDIDTESPGNRELVYSHEMGFHINVWDEGRERKVYNEYLDINTLPMYQKLFEWHFDVFGLLDHDLAIQES